METSKVTLENGNTGRVNKPLGDLIKMLLETDIEVLMANFDPNETKRFVYLKRGNNVADVQYNPLGGYAAHFPIAPSRALGSSLMITEGMDERGATHDLNTIFKACHIALSDSYSNHIIGNHPMKNHGMKHIHRPEFTSRIMKVDG